MVVSATVPAEHVRDPRRTIPRATLFGTVVAAVVYILSNTAVQGILPPDALAHSSAPFADAARVMLGDWGYYFIAGGAVIACLGALNGWVLLQGQIPMAPARDGLFPAILARTSRRGVPAHIARPEYVDRPAPENSSVRRGDSSVPPTARTG